MIMRCEVRLLAVQRQLVDPAMAAAARAWPVNTVRAFLSEPAPVGSLVPAVGRPDRRCNRANCGELCSGAVGPGRCQRGGTRDRGPLGGGDCRYLVHIGWTYRMAGRTDPVANPLVRLELKATRKKVGTAQIQARAIRFKGDVTDLDGPPSGICLATLIKACRKDLLGARDEALLRVAYDTGCRRSELVAIDVQHIEGPDGEGAAVLLIPRSKTDREG
jgi:hypothetical protein